MRQIDSSLLVSKWIKPPGIGRWLQNTMREHNLKNIDLIRAGISPENMQYWKYRCSREPRIWNQKHLCRVLAQLSGLTQTELYLSLREELSIKRRRDAENN